MPKELIEEPDVPPREKVARLIAHLGPLQNTGQYSWFIDIAQTFFDFQEDQVTPDNWESLYDRALDRMGSPDWSRQVLEKSKLEAVFLTNEFDDPLESGEETGG